MSVYDNYINKIKQAYKNQSNTLNLVIDLFNYLWEKDMKNVVVDLCDMDVIPRIRLSSKDHNFKHSQLFFNIDFNKVRQVIQLNIKALHASYKNHIKMIDIRSSDVLGKIKEIINPYIDKYFKVEESVSINQISLFDEEIIVKGEKHG